MTNTNAKPRHGRYVTCDIGEHVCALHIADIREIMDAQEILPLPEPELFPQAKGLVNVRGKKIPVFESRRALQLPNAEPTVRTCLVIMQVQADGSPSTLIALEVDGTRDVVNVTPDQMLAFVPAENPVHESVMGELTLKNVLILFLNPNGFAVARPS